MAFIRHTAFTLLFVSLLTGCGSNKGDMSPERLKKLSGKFALEAFVPVSGTVMIDGEPQAGVNLYLYGSPPATPLKECRTDDEGNFCWSTYTACDGLAPGNYTLGFEYVPKMKKNDSGVDLFKGKYKNPAKNEYKLTVEEGAPQTDVTYELKLK
ncbi:hypothetical protein [Schlesneria sp.]|uniref:hypothetical protein n=1 Tax=Schlesneria sp. TaxID=2762018 RepID=UPI002F0B53CB